MFSLSPVLLADAPTVVNEAAPVVESNGSVEILMADGTARRVRKIMGMTGDALRVMTDEGIGKIPLATLHAQSIAKLASMMESPEERQARLAKEAAAQESYRQNQALKERMIAEENAQRGSSMRAEEARQEAARQAAAAAYAQQQQYFADAMKAQDAQREKRNAEVAAFNRERDRMDMEDRQRQQQYEREVAAANAAAAATAAQNTPAQPAGPGPLAAMMPAHSRAASGVDKLDMDEQTALKNWVDHPGYNAPTTNTWAQKLDPTEKQVLTTWMN